VRVSVPFSYAGSKNHIWRLGGHHVEARQEMREFGLAIERELAIGLREVRVVQNKLWVTLLIEKPDHRGDAINLIDLCCDAIKRATNLDDRWYCIKGVDWRIAKKSPCIVIAIGQEDDVDVQPCSACGHLQPLAAYGRRSDTRLGVERICKLCRKRGRELALFKAAEGASAGGD
jgi:hypothetical protein